jgi:hypothetical protein
MALQATLEDERELSLDWRMVAFEKSLPKRNGRLKNGGNHPVRKVVWPT